MDAAANNSLSTSWHRDSGIWDRLFNIRVHLLTMV